jgi:mono/diheme cytochrome c family protein
MTTMAMRRGACALLVGGMLIAPTWARAGADEGKAQFEKTCKICHSIGGEGGKMADKGGPLDGVGAKHDAAWLKAYIADPKSKNPEAKMPKLKLGDEQLNDLAAYLSTLKAAK